MHCRRFHAWLDRYLEGDLSERRMRAMEDHANSCPSCAHWLKLQRKYLETVAMMGDPQVPGSLKQNVMLQVSANPEPMPLPSRKLGLIVTPLALGCIVLAFGFYSGWFSPSLFGAHQFGSIPTPERGNFEGASQFETPSSGREPDGVLTDSAENEAVNADFTLYTTTVYMAEATVAQPGARPENVLVPSQNDVPIALVEVDPQAIAQATNAIISQGKLVKVEKMDETGLYLESDSKEPVVAGNTIVCVNVRGWAEEKLMQTLNALGVYGIEPCTPEWLVVRAYDGAE
nr:zf-HC2 domain-containing protein [bacterium]